MQPSKLKWKAIGLKRKTQQLLKTLNEILAEIPEEQTNKRRTPQNLINELEYILAGINKIDQELIPRLEEYQGIELKNKELMYLAMSQISLRNVFTSIKDHLMKNNKLPIPENELDELANIGEIGKTLALLGDSVLGLATIEIHWSNIFSTVGELTTIKSEQVRNKKLAAICDDWGLYDYRIENLNSKEKSKEVELNHLKGTLIEAVLGIIYIDMDYSKILEVVPILQ
ncbi:MAG: ribonuclease III domain-containing protein [Candidatus Heimdallarchaeota archaeon]|nr:ribonuclease III domain-containing protein [Candidatus Heimdallarchaeota archaeon]MDH5646114.1 ribonuclease III domain-containing protein [Candidatus Heimdallarchaeota archaeon]